MLNQINIDKWDDLYRIQNVDVPKEADRWNGDNLQYGSWNGAFFGGQMWAYQETMQTQLNYQRYMYDKYYPVAREAEQTKDEVYRKRIDIERVKTGVFFFNPIVQFSNLSSKITGNSREDHLRFLHDARQVRDDLVNQGVTDGWLFDYRFITLYEPEYDLPPLMDLYNEADGDMETFYALMTKAVLGTREIAVPYKMELPVIRKYTQPVFSFGEVFGRIFATLSVFVVCILGLWVMSWYRFMHYDVR